MLYQSNQEEEEEKLASTQTLIDQNVAILEDMTLQALENLKEVSALYAEGEAGFYLDIPAAKLRYDLQKKELDDNLAARSSPYFGKTIFSYIGQAQDEIHYFGKKGIADRTDSETRFVITDWRAPVAEVYYSSKLGETVYTAPKGKIAVDLKLKTTIKIKNGEILGLYDAEVVTNDELLSEYLSQNKDTVLNEIIATIQEDQNRMIRRPLSRSLIIQGVAGSGKTTVALHRIAYLLYNYKEEITFSNICLVAANKLFLQYITGMLPDLDVPAIKQRTMADLLVAAIRCYSPKYSVKYIAPPLTGVLDECYSNDRYPTTLSAFLKKQRDEIFAIGSVSFLRFEFLSGEETNRVAFSDTLSLIEKASIFDKRIVERMALLKENVIEFVSANKFDKQVAKAAAESFSLTPAEGVVILEDTLYLKWTRFTAKYKNYFTKLVKGQNARVWFSEFTSRPFGIYGLNDLACYVSMQAELFGVKQQDDIKHIIIDEAQDFGIPVYDALRRLYPEATFTVVGDIMQNIRTEGLQSWEVLQQQVFGPRTEYATLIKSYRNTIEISEFAREAIRRISGITIEVEPIIRHGDEVGVHKYVTPPEKAEMLFTLLEEYNTRGFGLTAIICKTQEDAQKLLVSMKRRDDIKLMEPEKGAFEQGTYIVSLENVKGLEFDAVVVWDFDNYEKEDVKPLYVALTRALHKLDVFSNAYIV